MSDRLVKYLQHLVHSSSLYPVWTFWLACVIVVPATGMEWISHGEAVVFLGVVALILVLIADKRDAHHETVVQNESLSAAVEQVHQIVNSASEQQDARIDQLIDVIEAHGLIVPTPPEDP